MCFSIDYALTNQLADVRNTKLTVHFTYLDYLAKYMLFIPIAIFACYDDIIEQLLEIPLLLAIAMSLIRALLTSFLVLV